MQPLTESAAEIFARAQFAKLPALYAGFNVVHSQGLMAAAADLAVAMRLETDMNRLRALAWLHDTGKVVSDEGHAAHSVALAQKEFSLSKTDRDCILQHGSGAKPLTQEGNLFRCADGLSLFYPQCVLYRFWGDGKEGVPFERVTSDMKSIFEKYEKAYANTPAATDLLRRRYDMMFLRNV